MTGKEYAVRIIKTESSAVKVRFKRKPANKNKRNKYLLKIFNILAGSGIGLAAGLLIYLMLRSFGADFGGFESSLIIGLPSVLGIVTSLVIF